MGATADGEGARNLPRRGFKLNEVGGAHQSNDQPATMPDDPGRLGPDSNSPGRLTGGQIDRHNLAGALKGNIGKAAIGAEGNMAGLIRLLQPPEQGHGASIIDVHLVATKAGNDQVFPIRTVFQVIRIGNPYPIPQFAGSRVQEN